MKLFCANCRRSIKKQGLASHYMSSPCAEKGERERMKDSGRQPVSAQRYYWLKRDACPALRRWARIATTQKIRRKGVPVPQEFPRKADPHLVEREDCFYWADKEVVRLWTIIKETLVPSFATQGLMQSTVLAELQKVAEDLEGLPEEQRRVRHDAYLVSYTLKKNR